MVCDTNQPIHRASQNLATIIKLANQSGISSLPFANEVAVPFSADWLITQGGKVSELWQGPSA